MIYWNSLVSDRLSNGACKDNVSRVIINVDQLSWSVICKRICFAHLTFLFCSRLSKHSSQVVVFEMVLGSSCTVKKSNEDIIRRVNDKMKIKTGKRHEELLGHVMSKKITKPSSAVFRKGPFFPI